LGEEQRIVVVGASAGGVDALTQLARNLPYDFPAPVCMVLHIPADSPSLLPHILNRDSSLPVVSPEDGQHWEGGTIYIAPPDRHLLVSDDGTLHVTRDPRENRHRPAIDPLFRSAAVAFGARAIGIVLTGTMDDGTAGLEAIRKRGGLTIVQDPREALYPEMPQSAIAHVRIDHVVGLRAMGELLTRLVAEPAPRSVRDHPRRITPAST
jgi:two-component system chemotaxis response regulator CheB